MSESATPRVTMAGSTNRPSFFPWHIPSILDHNETSVELIYCGHAEFPDELKGRWEQLRYYRAPAEVSPAACAAWALEQGTGDLLFHAIDDYDFEPGLLDAMVAAYDAEADYKLLPSPRYIIDEGQEIDRTEWLRLADKPELPYLPLDGLISRQLYRELGGCDRRFFAVQHFVDVCARAVLVGARTVFPGGYVRERRTQYPEGYQSICARHADRDRPLLERMWFRDGTYEAGAPRVVPLEPYTAEDFAAIGARLELQS